jgi:hypothetical protein
MPVRQLLDVGSWQQLSVDLLLWDGGSVPISVVPARAAGKVNDGFRDR